MDTEQLNALLNMLQTVLLAWIAAHPGNGGGSQRSGRMQRNAPHTD